MTMMVTVSGFVMAAEKKDIIPQIKENFTNITLKFFEQAKKRWHDLPSDWALIKEKMKDLGKTNCDLGLLHLHRGNISDAKFRFKLTLKFKPDYPLAFYGLGSCAFYEGDKETAKILLEKALAMDPTIEDATYMLALLEENVLPSRVPSFHIKNQFNDLASIYYEDWVDNMDYQAHRLLVQRVVERLPDPEAALTILDLGCGTGLVGQELRKQTITIDRLVGVDIAESMLSEARKARQDFRPVYDHLHQNDFMDYLATTEERFDVVVACYSLHYIQDIQQQLELIARVLKPHGLIAFTQLVAKEKPVEFSVHSEQFTWSLDHVRAAGAGLGLSELFLEEGGLMEDVNGAYVLFLGK